MKASPTPGPAAVTVAEISDPATAGAGAEPLEQHTVVLGDLPLQARRVVVRLGPATVVYHSTNLRVRTRTAIKDGSLAYAVFGPRATGTVEGLPVGPDMMAAVEPGSTASLVVDPGYESVAVLVQPDEVVRQFGAHGHEAEFRRPHGVELLRCDDDRALALFRLGRRLVAAASRQPALFANAGPGREAAGVRVFEALLAAIRSAKAFVPRGPDRTRQTHGRIVATAERYVLARPAERVLVADLCRAANVSERTLQSAFRRVTGLAPVAYLTRLRLHRVRVALLGAESRSTAVSTEALNWGFRHFGEFSRAYRQCFVERPSETLRRAPRRLPSPIAAAAAAAAAASGADGAQFRDGA
jgi:AraC-like DNA-binding protein